MPKPVQKLRSRGFTLIELLIVIAVIGILATAVLSAINPIEQFKKGRDTSKKSDAAEIVSAVERYYATFEATPWPSGSKPNQTAMASGDAGIGELISKNELKTQFRDRTNLSKLFVTEDAATELVTVCFLPESIAFRAKAKRTITGTDNTSSCATWSSSCYVCLPE